MKFIVLFLSIALIFLGIAAVMYVDANSAEPKRSTSSNNIQHPQLADEFTQKYSMREIDSITAEYNYPFTIRNAVKAAPSDSSAQTTKKI